MSSNLKINSRGMAPKDFSPLHVHFLLDWVMGKVQPPFPGCLAWRCTKSVPKVTSSETRNPNPTERSPSCHQLFPKGAKCPQNRGSIRFGENGRVTILHIPMEIYNWQSTDHFSICLVVLLWMNKSLGFVFVRMGGSRTQRPFVNFEVQSDSGFSFGVTQI